MPSRPRILVTNDDGILSPGLAALATALHEELGEVTVVAPDREQSAVSHALTIRHPLRIHQRDEGWWAVEGTPTDCVYLAIFQILEEKPDLVVSGINNGYNLGDDVTYSGTVAGALEGRLLGVPSVAVSTEAGRSTDELADAARIAALLARKAHENGIPVDGLVNVNIPPTPKGYRITRQGKRAYRSGLVTRQDPKGQDYHWIGLVDAKWVEDPGADHACIEEGYVSVSPLHSDLTFHRAIPELEAWGLPREETP